MRFSLRAVHVHHGISPHAGEWAEFCHRLCRRHAVPLHVAVADLAPHRAHGLEAAARRARYQLLAGEDADFVVLAHHRDDQAESLLLQLLRGAGPAGLAGMPLQRELSGSRASLLRPLLEVSRGEIAAFARERELEWIEDESNADTQRARNFIRLRVLPLLEERYPAARATIARSAGHLGEAEEMLAALARIDLAPLERDESIDGEGLRRLGGARAKNVLRYISRKRGVAPPPAARIEEFWRQLLAARAGAAVCVDLPGWQFRVHLGRVYFERRRTPPPPDYREIWGGEGTLPLLALGGVLRFKPEEGRGVSAARLRRAEVTVRVRRGGERLQPDGRRPRRTLKNLLLEHRIPPWRREHLPCLYCGDELVSVPGIGDDCAWQAAKGEPGLIITWEWLDPVGQR